MLSATRIGFAAAVAGALGCAPESLPPPAGLGATGTGRDTADQDEGSDANDSTGDPSTGDSTGNAGDKSDSSGSSTGVVPTLLDCTYPSSSFGGALAELDEAAGSTARLGFAVPNLPDPALVESATLRFDTYDADHPGQEGEIFVNGEGPFDLPADASWDNTPGSGILDVTASVVEGDNTIEFGAGSLRPRSIYQVGNVAVDITGYVEDCESAPDDGPLGDAVVRQVEYTDATYTMRHNWVLRSDYAFTAYGDEHMDSDIEGLYDPDGTRLGTATFSFDDVVPATYEIQIRSRHTENRNPVGALFVVDGEGTRINQRDDADFTTDIWGTRDLGGDVTVVLDSAQEGGSDSVIWVRLEPVG